MPVPPAPLPSMCHIRVNRSSCQIGFPWCIALIHVTLVILMCFACLLYPLKKQSTPKETIQKQTRSHFGSSYHSDISNSIYSIMISWLILWLLCAPMVEGFNFTHSMVDGNMKCYLVPGAAFGEACYWEEQYLLHSISASGCAKRRKKENRGKVFEKLCEHFALPEIAVKRPAADDDTRIRVRALRTDAVLPWLLQTYQNLKDHGQGMGCVSKSFNAIAMAKQFGLISLQGWSADGARDAAVYEVVGKLGDDDVRIGVEQGIINVQDMLEHFPFLIALRDAVHAKRPDVNFAELGNSSVVSWAFVFYYIVKDKLARPYSAIFVLFARSMMQSLFKATAVGADLYLAYVFLPGASATQLLEPLQRLRSDTGRRNRLDQHQLGWTIREMNRVAGSTTTIAACASGNAKVDQLITHAIISELFHCSHRCMQNTSQISIVWDPGSYSGHQYNVTYIMDVGSRIATAAPIKV